MVERDTIMEEVLESGHHKKNIIEEEEEEEEIMAPGFRFHPTDEELVGFYLQRKVQKKPLPIQLIKQIDIYKYDPWDLPMSSKGEGGMIEEGYYFCMRGRKYRNSIRPNRVTVSGSGFWKATGIDKPIYKDKDNININNNIIIGLKKSLVYYLGTAGKGSKTDWMMHEFRLPPQQTQTTTHHNLQQESEVWTLCRIFKRMPSHKKFTPSPSTNATTSKASSLRSSDINGHSPTCFTTFKDSLIINVQQQNDDHERKQIMNNNNNNNGDQVEQYERNHLFLGHHEFLPQAPIPPLVSYPNCPSFWNPNNNDVMMEDQDVFANYGNWDELGPVVHLAMGDPLSKLYHNHDCTD